MLTYLAIALWPCVRMHGMIESIHCVVADLSRCYRWFDALYIETYFYYLSRARQLHL